MSMNNNSKFKDWMDRHELTTNDICWLVASVVVLIIGIYVLDMKC